MENSILVVLFILNRIPKNFMMFGIQEDEKTLILCGLSGLSEKGDSRGY